MLIACIVPPFTQEYLLHQGSRKEFHHGRHNGTAQSQEKEISFQRTEEDKDQHHTETIYWTERSV